MTRKGTGDYPIIAHACVMCPVTGTVNPRYSILNKIRHTKCVSVSGVLRPRLDSDPDANLTVTLSPFGPPVVPPIAPGLPVE